MLNRRLFRTAIVFWAALAVAATTTAQTESPFRDAVALWQMNDLQGSGRAPSRLEPAGKAEVGVRLEGQDLAASLARGGDGYTAWFGGGYLTATSEAPIQLAGRNATVCLRLRDPAGKWNSCLLAAADPEDRLANLVYSEGQELVYRWRTTPPWDRVEGIQKPNAGETASAGRGSYGFNGESNDAHDLRQYAAREWIQNSTDKQQGRRAALLAQGSQGPAGLGMMRNRNFAEGVLPVSAPVDWFGRDGWHDVVIRFADTVVELYVDGVLIDEEWPHGQLYRFCSPFLLGAGYGSDGKVAAGFTGEIDHMAFWDRALSAREITALSGGEQYVARRDIEILGRPQESLQYWKPRGKAYAGDCMVTCHDGVFHIFYLYDRLHHGAKWGLGAHQYGHFSSSDLKHWTEHPLAVPIDQQWECAMGTGSVIHNEKDEKWYAFYTDCGSRIQFFDKPQRGAWLFRSVSEDGIHFQKDFKPVLPGFDSDIFFVPETGQFHLIAEGGRTHYQSADLVEWTAVDDSEFRKTAQRDNLSRICPDTLAWNGWYYFTTGSASIYKSRTALGPWELIPNDIFDGLYYSKMHEFKDGRALAAGWVGFPAWGGNLVVRELVQTADGNLGLKFVAEMSPAVGSPLALPVTANKGDAHGDLQELSILARESLAYAAVDKVPHDVRIRLTVRPSEGVEAFGLCLRGEGDYQQGSELSFRPAKKHVQFGHPRNGGLDEIQAVRHTMSGDTGAMPPVLGLDRPFTVELIAKERMLDVCIDNRRTFIARRDELGGERLFFFARGGKVVFEGIKICPLAEG